MSRVSTQTMSLVASDLIHDQLLLASDSANLSPAVCTSHLSVSVLVRSTRRFAFRPLYDLLYDSVLLKSWRLWLSKLCVFQPLSHFFLHLKDRSTMRFAFESPRAAMEGCDRIPSDRQVVHFPADLMVELVAGVDFNLTISWLLF